MPAHPVRGFTRVLALALALFDQRIKTLLGAAREMLCLAVWMSSLIPSALHADWSGFVAGESWYFPNRGALQPDQYQSNFSLAVQPEYFRAWSDGTQLFKFTGFLRIDREDDERTHWDIRELTWIKVGEDHEWRVGVRKVFWGVTEFVHLVDIVNQTDYVEDPDADEKLGQPMVNLALVRDWGTLDLFALLGFRERTFPCPDCRFQTDPPVDPDKAVVEDETRVDWAVRWSHFFGDWDIGAYYFNGISRDPSITPGTDLDAVTLTPLYELIDQVGVDIQATKGDWLWKLEGYRRAGQGSTFSAATGGFEYTFVRVFDTSLDVGAVVEYMWDERDRQALTPYENDVGFGARLTFNDTQSTELLLGAIVDAGRGSRVWQLEASRRLGDLWTLDVEGRAFQDIPPDDFFLYGLRNDDFIRLELRRYF